MKKLFTNPVVEIKSLSAENDVMAVFLSSEPVVEKAVITDTASQPTDNEFGYWSAK